MCRGVSLNLFLSNCSRWVSSATWQEGIPKAWHAAARQGLCGLKQKASKKCSIPIGAMKATFVQLDPITFPGIHAPEGLFLNPYGPKNVARKVTVIHCIPKDISELVSLLILLPRDGESIPTFSSTPIYLNCRELPLDPGSKPPASVQVHHNKVQLFAPLGHYHPQ